MKNIIKKILKEQSNNRIDFGDSDLPRYINPQRISKFTITKYEKRGYKPFYVDGGRISELPRIDKERMNNWGVIYFFNDEEVKKIIKLQDKVTKLKEQIKKQMELVDEYVMSYIHDRII